METAGAGDNAIEKKGWSNTDKNRRLKRANNMKKDQWWEDTECPNEKKFFSSEG